MNMTDLGKAISQYGAPLLGTVIGGPAGGMIGQLVAHAFNGDLNDTEKLIQSIASDPEADIKLAQIESTYKLEIQRLLISSETERMKQVNENTADARKMNQQHNSNYPQILSSVVILSFMICIYWVVQYKQDKSDHDILYMLLGVMGSAFNGVINFWLGSSADKTFNMTKVNRNSV